MPKILILGNSAAGFSCAKNLLQNNPDLEITVATLENYPAYKRNLLPDYLSGAVSDKDIFLCGDDFYEKNGIKFLRNAKASRIDTRKNTVALKDNTKLSYDYLVIATGGKIKLPDIPGTNKDGVFSFYSLEDVKNIKQRLMLPGVVCVAGEPKSCAVISQIVAAKDKEVKVISVAPPQGFIPSDKIEWIDSLNLTEIIGDGLELKAVKLSNGKAIGVSLVLFCGNRVPSSEFLKESGIKTDQDYIALDDSLRTNIENIFACGAVCGQRDWDVAAGAGVKVAQNIIQLLERGKIACQ